MVQFRAEIAECKEEKGIPDELIGNIDEMPMEWMRNGDKTWVLSMKDVTKRTEVRPTPKDLRWTPEKKLGHCDRAQYANQYLTIVTCTTPFVKGPIMVLAKDRQVGTTVAEIARMNQLDTRFRREKQ